MEYDDLVNAVDELGAEMLAEKSGTVSSRAGVLFSKAISGILRG
jgi:hypothetical protein